MSIRDSVTKTLTIQPAIVPTDTGNVAGAEAVLIADAGPKMLRVMARNISSGIDVYLAYDKAALLQLPDDGAAYTLPAGMADVFVLMPRQKLYIATLGLNPKVSFAISQIFLEDLPDVGTP